MEILLVLVALLLVVGLPLAIAVVPPVVMGAWRRWSPAGLVLWLLALGMLAAWMAAGSADIDRADATGGTGSIWAGVGWLLGAAAAATASAATVRRHTPRPAASGS